MKTYHYCVILVSIFNDAFQQHIQVWERYKDTNSEFKVLVVHHYELVKFIKEIHQQYRFDYFIHTDISSFWDLYRLQFYLKDLPKENYYSGDEQFPYSTKKGIDTISTHDVFESIIENLDKTDDYRINVLKKPVLNDYAYLFESIENIDRQMDESISRDKNHYRIKTGCNIQDIAIYKQLLFKIYQKSLFPKEFADSILVTGGNGMIGSRLDFGIRPSSSVFDITNIHSIETFISNHPKKISCILHMAAINLRDSEKNPEASIQTNINGTLNVLKIAKQKNIPFVLVSTGAVFSSFNSNVIFDEKCVKNPNCIYGHTKSTSEEIALVYDKTIIVRTGWLFGGHQKTHYKFVENTIMNLLANHEVYASDNFYGSPTYVYDFIEQLKYLIENEKYGIHHVVNSEYGSGYDIACYIARVLNKNKQLIIPVPSENIPNSGPRRSHTEMLTTIHSYNKLRNWKSALEEYVEKYMKNIGKDDILKTAPNKKKWSNRERCRLCNSYHLHVFFQLNPTPPANHFVQQPIYQDLIPLDVAMCKDCCHFQLIQIVDPAFQYSNYFYVSSTTTTMIKHLETSCMRFTQMYHLTKTDSILEIGANDGVCINHLINNGFVNTVGVDPAENINKRHNLPIICDFFGSRVCQKLKEKYKAFRLIFAFHCCAHIEDINDVFETVQELLTDDGIFIIEVGYFYQVFKNNAFDTIYHEHIDYHTVSAMIPFASSKHLKLINVELNRIQGGSIQFHFCKNSHEIEIQPSVQKALLDEQSIGLFDLHVLSRWKNNIMRTGKDLYSILNSFYSEGKTIIGYGASAKSTTFLYQFRITNKIIKFIIDDNIYKQNYFTPGLHIPIRPFHFLESEHVDYVLLLSWNFVDEIIEKLKEYKKSGIRIIIPFPDLKII